MTKIKVYIRPDQTYSGPIQYALDLIVEHQDIELDMVALPSDGAWIYDHESKRSASIHHQFYDALDAGEYDALKYRNGLVRYDNNVIDPLASIFYMVNCLQELDPKDSDLDKYGRFRYQASYQYADGTMTKNLVQDLINGFLSDRGIYPKVAKSKVFISHDVDFLYGSKSEDVKWAMRTFSIGKMLKIIFNEVIGKPHWRNIDRVMAINDAHDIRSTFFWLVNKGRGTNGVPNADYDFKNQKDIIQLIESNGGINGLHKSASRESINQEINKSDQDWIHNRYHYLKFQTHQSWRDLSDSKIKMDCSLGFAEHFGFRNSYGRPFLPYDIENGRPYDFVEMPLHIMDATFLHYLKTDPNKIGATVIDFMERHKQDCVLSILWHNNYLTDYAYKPFLLAYKEILGYIHDNDLESINPDTIINQYLLTRAAVL